MLIAAFNQGRDGALARFGVKTAAVPLARPRPFKAPTPAAGAPVAPAAPRAPNHLDPTPQEAAQIKRMQQNPASGAQELGLDRNSQNDRFMQEHGINPNAGASPMARAAAGAAGGARKAWGPIKKTLALGGLGAGAALGYGLLQDHKEDRAKYPLVYAPMQGSMMG
jgi:hypothetical protein